MESTVKELLAHGFDSYKVLGVATRSFSFDCASQESRVFHGKLFNKNNTTLRRHFQAVFFLSTGFRWDIQHAAI
jgi:hypothetical protein